MEHINKIQDKNHTIILLDAEKAFEKSPAPINDINTQQARNRKKLTPPDKKHLPKKENCTETT